MTKIFYPKWLSLLSKSNQGWCQNHFQKSYQRMRGKFYTVGKKSRSGIKSAKYIFVKLSFFHTLYKGQIGYQDVRCQMWQDRNNGAKAKSFLHFRWQNCAECWYLVTSRSCRTKLSSPILGCTILILWMFRIISPDCTPPRNIAGYRLLSTRNTPASLENHNFLLLALFQIFTVVNCLVLIFNVLLYSDSHMPKD